MFNTGTSSGLSSAPSRVGQRRRSVPEPRTSESSWSTGAGGGQHPAPCWGPHGHPGCAGIAACPCWAWGEGICSAPGSPCGCVLLGHPPQVAVTGRSCPCGRRKEKSLVRKRILHSPAERGAWGPGEAAAGSPGLWERVPVALWPAGAAGLAAPGAGQDGAGHGARACISLDLIRNLVEGEGEAGLSLPAPRRRPRGVQRGRCRAVVEAGTWLWCH